MFYDLSFNADDLEPFAARERSAAATSLGYNVVAVNRTVAERLTAKDRCMKLMLACVLSCLGLCHVIMKYFIVTGPLRRAMQVHCMEHVSNDNVMFTAGAHHAQETVHAQLQQHSTVQHQGRAF